MWAGTNDAGIFRFEDGKTTQYSTRTGLPSDVVFCLVPDASGGPVGMHRKGWRTFPQTAGSRKSARTVGWSRK